MAVINSLTYWEQSVLTYNIAGKDARWYVFNADTCGEYGSVVRGLDARPMTFPTALAAQRFVAKLGGECLNTFDTTAA